MSDSYLAELCTKSFLKRVQDQFMNEPEHLVLATNAFGTKTVLFVALLSGLGPGARMLFRLEVPGPRARPQ